MTTNDILVDAFSRIQGIVHSTAKDLSRKDLTFRPTGDANTIAWLIWHLTRIQDDHISDLAKHEQVWVAAGWNNKFDLPFDNDSTGYGHSSDDVAAVDVGADLLIGYYDAVHEKSIAYITELVSDDYEKIVDKRWDPAVTLAVRLVSVLSDDLQHAGQAAYIRGLLK